MARKTFTNITSASLFSSSLCFCILWVYTFTTMYRIDALRLISEVIQKTLLQSLPLYLRSHIPEHFHHRLRCVHSWQHKKSTTTTSTSQLKKVVNVSNPFDFPNRAVCMCVSASVLYCCWKWMWWCCCCYVIGNSRNFFKYFLVNRYWHESRPFDFMNSLFAIAL